MHYFPQAKGLNAQLDDSCFPGNPPFTNTGLDYSGPFCMSVEHSVEKCWRLPFTCVSSGAVIFEVVPSLDSSSYVMGIERFLSRRGVPSVIWSGNGKNFGTSGNEFLNNILICKFLLKSVSSGISTHWVRHNTELFGND